MAAAATARTGWVGLSQSALWNLGRYSTQHNGDRKRYERGKQHDAHWRQATTSLQTYTHTHPQVVLGTLCDIIHSAWLGYRSTKDTALLSYSHWPLYVHRTPNGKSFDLTTVSAREDLCESETLTAKCFQRILQLVYTDLYLYISFVWDKQAKLHFVMWNSDDYISYPKILRKKYETCSTHGKNYVINKLTELFVFCLHLNYTVWTQNCFLNLFDRSQIQDNNTNTLFVILY